jgi:hypothetical protein
MTPFKLKYNPINIDEKQFTKWLVALWENKHPQTKGSLQDNKGYCCLGVACKELIPENQLRLFDGYMRGSTPYGQDNSPKWLKMVSDNLYNLAGDGLVSLNDGHNFTFPQIADILYQVYVLGEYTTDGY